MICEIRTNFWIALVMATLFVVCSPVLRAQAFGDTVYQLPASACPGSIAGANGNTYAGQTAVGTGLMVLGATLTPVYQIDSTNAGTNTHSYVCEIVCPTRLTSGKGCSAVAGVAFFYGVQSAALASQTLSTAFTVSFAAPAAAEAASTVGGAAAGGTITQLPVVASANLGTTTAGAFFTTYASFGTTVALNGNYQKLYVSFVFPNTATTATKSNTAGGTVFTTNTIAWLRRHSEHNAVLAMSRLGISRETARLIWRHYHQRDPMASAWGSHKIVPVDNVDHPIMVGLVDN